MSKQTAVEWLIEQVNEDCLNSIFIRPELIDQAKAMERDQIEDAYKQGRFDEIDAMDDLSFNPVAERYYQETYKGGEQ